MYWKTIWKHYTEKKHDFDPKCNNKQHAVKERAAKENHRVIHREVDKCKTLFLIQIINYAKKAGTFKTWWGPYVHPMEGVDGNSSPGDIKRSAKFAIKSTNYNASMTSIDIFGIY